MRFVLQDLYSDKHDGLSSYRNVNESMRSSMRKSGIRGEGRFECQPEYRKAYIDYLVKEKKPPLVPKKRLVEMFDGKEKVESSTNEDLR